MRKVFVTRRLRPRGGSCEQGYTLQHTSFWHVRVGIGLNGVDLCHGERPVIRQVGGQLLVCQPGKSQVDNLPFAELQFYGKRAQRRFRDT